MKHFQVEKKKKTSTLPWIIAAIIALALVIFLQNLLNNYSASSEGTEDSAPPGQPVDQ